MGGAVSTALSVVGSAIIGAGVVATGGIAWSTVALGASMVAGSVALAPKPRVQSLGNQNYQQQTSNRSLMIKQPITVRDTVYGESKKSGSILFMETTDNTKRMHLVVQISSHEIQSFDKIYFNEEELTLSNYGTDARGIARFKPTAPSKYNKVSDILITEPKVRIKQHLGTDDQLADADLQAEVGKWTSAHRLRGIAYLYIRLEYDADMFPNGIPNVSAEIKGKKVLDFRSGSTTHSDNPALCIYDYLTDTRLGLGISTSNVDTTSFTTMANLCDENVTLSAGGTEKRYTCNGVVFSDVAPMQVLDDMLTSCTGVLSYSNGKFILKGGQYVSPTITLTDDDFISQIALESKRSRKDLFNTVKGIFTSEETSWQPSDYPMVTSSTFSDADGEVIFADIDLPFTVSSATAQRIAKIALFKNRQLSKL